MDPEDEEIELQNGIEIEGQEQDIMMQNELIAVGKVNSVNGKTGDVVLTTSDLENDSDYQTGSEVESAISEAVADKQDKLTAGDNITIENNVISASDTTYTAGNGLSLNNENEFSVDTTVVATQQNLSTEVTNRENADINLQGQIDAISASSDVVDIVGTYAELQAYDTQHLKDNDIIKVLQDETQNNATTYYRWSTHTHTFTLIGQEGPYYTKASADAQFVPQTRTVNSKALSSNITLTASDVDAVATGDVVQATGNNTTKIMSQKATTDVLGLKLNISDYVVDNALADSTNPVQNKVLYELFSSMPSDFFTGPITVNGNGREITLAGTMNTKLSDVKMYGDTFQQAYSGKNLARNAYQSPVTSGNVTFTTNADGSISTSGTANTNINFYLTGSGTTYHLDAGTYTLSIGGVETSDTTCFVYIDGTSSVYWDTRNSSRLTQTVPAGGVNISPRIVVRSGFNTNGLTFKIQLESGSTATSYEPYVGGTASPNPDYPQDIQVVTGTQTVQVTGKNLLQSSLSTRTTNNITATPNADGSITLTGTSSSSNITWFVIHNDTFLLPAGTYTFSGGISSSIALFNGSFGIVTSATTKTFSRPTIGNWSIRIAPNATTNVTIYPQVEKGSTATAYEPYQSQTFTIDLGSTKLAKIGDYQDYIYKSGDDWYVHKEIDSGTLTGTTTGMTVSQQSGTGRFNIVLPTSWTGYKHQTNSILAFCNSYHLVGQSEYNSGFDNVVTDMSYALNFNSGGGNALRVKNVDATTVQEMKDSMTATPLVLYYALATATDTKITDGTLIGELEALRDAYCYDGTTILETSANGLSAILDVTAFKKTLAGLIGAINR